MGEPDKRLAQVRGGFVILSSLPVPHAHTGVGPGVARITAKDLVEIVGRIDERIVELKVTKTYQIAFLRVLNFLRKLRTLDNRRKRFVRILDNWSISQHRLAGSVLKSHCQGFGVNAFIKLYSVHEWLVRSDIRGG